MAGKCLCASCGKEAVSVVTCFTDRAVNNNTVCAEQSCKDAVAALTRRQVDVWDLRNAIAHMMGSMTPYELAKRSATTVKEVNMVLASNLTVSTDESLSRMCKAVGLLFFGMRK